MSASGVRIETGEIDLRRFNEQVLACQHEAYTLAVQLLGDEQRADAIVRDAVVQTYRQLGTGGRSVTSESIRISVLQRVLKRCGHDGRRRRGRPSSLFGTLSKHEARALLLVDVLHLSYDEASQVLRCSRDDVARWLAAARVRLVKACTSGTGELQPAV